MQPTFEHTKDNHYKWGWEGDEWYSTPDSTKRYQLHLGFSERAYGSLREEAVKAVKHIADAATKPIIVGLSGGSDSQMVCLSMLEAKIPFKALICSYRIDGGHVINEHDIKTAYEFCKKFNVPYEELNIDIDAFFKSRGRELATKYCMPKVETIIQTVAMDTVCQDHCYIMAGGDIMMTVLYREYAEKIGRKIINNRFSEPIWWESPVPVMQHMIANGYEGTSKFWLYTPELMLAYLNDPVTQMFLKNFDVIMDSYLDISNIKPWRCFHYLYKPIMTGREFPEIIRSKKYTGYENMYNDGFQIPGRITVYNKLLASAVEDLKMNQAITLPIADLIKYLSTPHSQTDTILSNKI